MALVTILEYLKNNELKTNILVNDNAVLNNSIIDFYVINKEYCWIYTMQGHQVKFDLTEFSKMTFDAAVFEAKNSIEMIQCLNKLDRDKPSNANLETDKGDFIAGFYWNGKQ